MKRLLPFLCWPLGFVIGQLFVRWVQKATISGVRESFQQYWSSMRWALGSQVLAIAMGAFLFRRGDFALAFMGVSFSFWFFALGMLVARPHPSRFERLVLPFVPFLILVTVHLLELHYAAQQSF